MIFAHRYAGQSGVTQVDDATAMSFAPDTLRPATYFRGRITKQVEFREAISALHDVVTADLRFIPKDRSAYHAWRAQQSYIDTAQLVADQKRVAQEMTALQGELAALEARSVRRRQAFYAARQRYFQHLYQRDKELWYKLDPVITVHPDQVFFECFSRDESAYGRLAASYEVFEELGERANGTTNIDYSEQLYGEFQKIRSYKTTSLEVDPSGFDVTTAMEETYREVKIDLPDTWVRGFLQVSSAATLPAHVLELHPMDVHNVCLLLRRNKELFGPRSLKFQLTPGAPVSIVVEPWGTVVRCPRSRYLDSKPGQAEPTEIRVWGRRRLFILERLLPRAKRVRVFLLGTGLPSYWVVDLGDLSFTLGLSGWTLNNWSEAGNFDLMASREDVDSVTQQRVFDELGKTWLATPAQLAAATGLEVPIVASALAGWVQAGRAIFDLDAGVYRKRELTRDPLPVDRLRFANDREAAAAAMLQRAKIAIDRADAVDGGLVLGGRIRDRDRLFAPELTFDSERRIAAGECSCDYFIRNRLHRGPCEHMLALRAAHRRGVNDTITFEARPSGTQRGHLASVPTRAQAAAQRAEAEASHETFQAAFRRAILRAAELRAAGKLAASIAELERIARLAPPDSDEHARLQEVIAESRFDAGDHEAARAAADRALRKLPASPLALRVKRDALVQLEDVPSAIPVAHGLAQVDNTPRRWDELVALCHRVEDFPAMLQFAEEGLRLHPRTAGLLAARAVARQHLSPEQAAAATAAARAADAADDADAPAKKSWWRRAVNKITGRGPSQATPDPTSDPASDPSSDPVRGAAASLDDKLTTVIEELAFHARVIDRPALLAALRRAYATAGPSDGKVFALVAALKASHAVRELPSDQDLIALLRRTLS
jgi:tetratricopeptide (TPR) repeat protein